MRFDFSFDALTFQCRSSCYLVGGRSLITFAPAQLMYSRLARKRGRLPLSSGTPVRCGRRNNAVHFTPGAEAVLRDIPEAARAIGLQIQVLNASTSREIEAAFATLVRDRADALFVAPDTFFSRRVQLTTLAARHGIPAAYSTREEVEAGGLMSYGTDTLDMWRHIGAYTGQILKGAKPADLVDKQPSAIDRRVMTLTLTPSGLQLRDKLLALRRDALTALLKHVSPDDLAPLERIAEIIVATLPENALSALTTCRYCDERCCVDCPMEVFGPLETPSSSTAPA